MKNAKKKSKAEKLQKAVDDLRTARGPRRRQVLAKAVELAGDTQEGRSFSYELARLGNSEAQAAAILAASEPAVRNAQHPRPLPLSPSIGRFGRSQEQTLRGVFDGSLRPLSLPREETELASQRRIVEAEANLQKAATPEARAEWGMRLTREKLIQGHRQGVI